MAIFLYMAFLSNMMMMKLMLYSCRFLWCLLLLLLFFHRLSQGRQHEDQDGCPSTSCGNISISYPFRLRGGESSACTDPLPLFELVCEANKAVLYDHHLPYENRYYVKEISYDNMMVRLVDADLASGDCRLPRTNSSVDMYTLLNGIRFPDVTSWVTFVSCSRESNGTRDAPYIPLPCLSTNDTNIVYAIFDAYRLIDLEPSCHSTAFTLAEYTPYLNGRNTNPVEQSDFFQLLQKGFLLSWRPENYWLCPNSRELYSEELYSALRELISSPTTLERVLFLFVVEVNIFGCLIIQDGLIGSHNFYLAISVAVILVVLLHIVLIHCIIRFIVAPVTVLVFLAYKSWRSYVPIDLVEKFLQNQGKLSPARYSYLQLVRMTDNFRDKLGQGGFGSVFKGRLPAGGHLVAVKMLLDNSGSCNGEDFINEVSTVGRIHHLNIVRLVGFCSEGTKRALVYEYMPNGSLDKYIFSSSNGRYFTMEKLNQIALAVAKGIDYLHRGCDMRILHFDIKPQNILLDHGFVPKLSDFGLAKLYPKDCSLVSMSAARGTIGYIAPEQVSRSFGVISYKSDVYSFGMLLMEMAGGRRNVNRRADNSSQVYYPSWIYDRLEKMELGLKICHVEIDGMERKLCKVGLWCIQMRPSDRPSMSRVIEMLEEDDVDALPMPPKPFLSNSLPISIQQYSGATGSSFTELSIISED
ncbi:LEAF RUST 10 DISEASE-RESISTANCE LOCUS RECEPTOR-LIKE PROTEIN KINASE-like 2.5 [Iris pallida]|uniref:LEAF RUST 10 DISEASE-RESISTANCE LOCUS RECEPTOR-LIKE PROTEIN KINASE-like 2.5 n=1 Tax=Iris pallida TaxID=29817 RepID=A0AAX6FDD4_IRIPA|nr:LEAF RUST 10 DISEASE-RESISTANCE LOCUS RECEPTOR-LIKE PROTEIN KINASE-like 2.5 [Iris pallida]